MSRNVESTAFRSALEVIAGVEPRVADAIRAELADQRESLKLIASENYASPATLLAMGNWFSDKYAEGTVGRRFYAGCQNVDTVEALAAEHARELFGAAHAYVQPHSGIDANLVAFWAILADRVEAPALKRAQARHVNDLTEADWFALRRELGDQRMLGMSLDAGGHLTHGFRPNISGKMFDQRSYGTDPATGLVDYDKVAEAAREFRPLVLVAGYSAYPRKVNFRIMREIADSVGATFMVDMAHFAGLVAGKVFTGDFDPVPHAHIVTTTTHKSLRGPRGGMVLCGPELADQVDRGCPMVLGGPLPHVMAAKAVALAEARRPDFADYAQRIVDNAQALAEGLLRRGAKLVTGGTDNHLVLIDVTGYGLTGRQAEQALLDSGIVTNRNAVPQDPNGAWYTSGVRIGTPALTTRGLGPAEMDGTAELIHTVLSQTTAGTGPDGTPSKAKYVLDPALADKISRQATELLASYPLYPNVDLA
ncbi:glycine hydroxymethyltransferase [Micromonospora endophytica]|uniref:Serine hydroxymethyltransferase n=1 Tax=Micromonospora endophytica TaxID=515350 RepID=A0A2W2CI94_9ACTN|nr:glycine hydroxymethyltransferase [Micromonospora endophytica]PZF99135.1 serine hydroxymethyltransferase [Micromonospora endophytica]RIW48236.1 glycine hydroxymethyltransferase [Micromonospora endophytica]BCJ56710.1 serine hydroxymethyltransferase [Micromonospora endophytica]